MFSNLTAQFISNPVNNNLILVYAKDWYRTDGTPPTKSMAIMVQCWVYFSLKRYLWFNLHRSECTISYSEVQHDHVKWMVHRGDQLKVMSFSDFSKDLSHMSEELGKSLWLLLVFINACVLLLTRCVPTNMTVFWNQSNCGFYKNEDISVELLNHMNLCIGKKSYDMES